MAHPNLLRDMLREDQEPFPLHHYIADKHCIHLYKPTFYQTSSLNLSLCTKSCFKPPLFHSSRKSPCRPSRPRSRAINIGFCSYWKRLWDKNKARKFRDKGEVNSEDARLSTAGWSESNEGKSLDMESSSSTSTYDYADIHSCENKCSSSEPFCFALQRSSYADHTPDFLSPVASPASHDKQHNYDEAESLQKIQVEKEEEEEKNQCSPVSVLAPPFQDRGEEEDEEDGEFDVECSYASVQRLRRFQRLAELDPVELQKRMLEADDEIVEEQVRNHVKHPESFNMEEDVDEVVRQVWSRSDQFDENKISSDVRQLLLQLIDEEKKSGPSCSTTQVVVSRVCKRLNEWKQVQSNTIDMMVELDWRKDVDVWKLYEEEVRDKVAKEIESTILGLLLEELVS